MGDFWGGFAGTLKDNIQQVGDEYRKLKALEDAEVRQDAREEKRYARNRLDAKADRAEELNDSRYLDPKYMTMEDGVLMAESMTTDAGGYRVVTKAPATAQQKAAWEANQKKVAQDDEEHDLTIRGKKVNIQSDLHRMALDELEFAQRVKHDNAMEANDRERGGSNRGDSVYKELPTSLKTLVDSLALYDDPLVKSYPSTRPEDRVTKVGLKSRRTGLEKRPPLVTGSAEMRDLARRAQAGDDEALYLLLPYLENMTKTTAKNDKEESN